MLDFEGDSIRLAITAKRPRRKPIDPSGLPYVEDIRVDRGAASSQLLISHDKSSKQVDRLELSAAGGVRQGKAAFWIEIYLVI